MVRVRAKLGNVEVGDGLPVAAIGVINLSRDSFFPGSVVGSAAQAVGRARELVEEGASVIDVGAMGTGPRSRPISPRQEMKSLVPVVKAISRAIDAPISVDTQRAEVAEAAIAAGASIVNDISGLKGDPGIAGVIASSGCSALLMAAEKLPGDVYTIVGIKRALKESLDICRREGIGLGRVVIDPAVGYWPGRLQRLGVRAERPAHGKKYRYATFLDLRILAKLAEFRGLGRPICVGLSRKSFVGDLLEVPDPSRRLTGSLAASAIAVINGVHVLRTHDPFETLQVARIAEAVRNF